MFGRLLGGVLFVLGACSEPVRAANNDHAGTPASLTGMPGDPVRGRISVADRDGGNCLLCHRLPIPGERFQGDLGPSLEGVGARLSAAEIRARLIDASRFNPATIMPPYYRSEGLTRVAAGYAGKTVLDAGAVEDIVAYLATLKD